MIEADEKTDRLVIHYKGGIVMQLSHFHMMPVNAFISKEGPQDKTVRPDGLAVYQLTLCTGGKGIFIDENDIRHEILPGDIFFMAPYVPHSYYPASEEPWNVIYVTFDGLSGFEELLEIAGLDADTTVIKAEAVADGQYMRWLFYSCAFEYAEHTHADAFIMCTVLYKIIYEIYKTIHKAEYSPVGEDIYLLAPVFEFISKNPSSPLSVEDISSATGYSEYFLYQKFAKALGTTPAEFVADKKMEYAARLLRDGELTVKQIAMECGIASETVFTRLFKRRFDTTPAAYRRTSAPGTELDLRCLPIYVTNVGEIRGCGEFSYDDVTDENSFQIMLCGGGNGIFTDHNGEEFFLRPGHIVFISPNASCVCRSQSEQWQASWVRFRGMHISRIVRFLGFDVTAVLRTKNVMVYNQFYAARRTYDFGAAMDRLYRNFYGNSTAAVLYSSVLVYELLVFCAIFTEELENRHSPEELLISPVTDIIDMYNNKDLNNSVLANAVGISEKHMTRLFKTVYRKTPKQYITDVRLKHAGRMLIRRPNMPVSQIAAETGFKTSGHFITVFKERNGITPNEYRSLYL